MKLFLCFSCHLNWLFPSAKENGNWFASGFISDNCISSNMICYSAVWANIKILARSQAKRVVGKLISCRWFNRSLPFCSLSQENWPVPDLLSTINFCIQHRNFTWLIEILLNYNKWGKPIMKGTCLDPRVSSKSQHADIFLKKTIEDVHLKQTDKISPTNEEASLIQLI